MIILPEAFLCPFFVRFEHYFLPDEIWMYIKNLSNVDIMWLIVETKLSSGLESILLVSGTDGVSVTHLIKFPIIY